jgi:hypothetical protein
MGGYEQGLKNHARSQEMKNCFILLTGLQSKVAIGEWWSKILIVIYCVG